MNKLFLTLLCTLISAFTALAQPEILWWYDLGAPSFGSSAVDDIDNDGLMEIVFGTYFNDEHVYALNAEDGSLLWSYDTGGCNDASPLIFDVDMDGDLEVILAASSPYHVYCFNGATGDIEWSVSTGYPNCIDSPPAAADVDNDGLPEIVFGSFYGNVFCLNGEDGSIEWQINLGTNSYIQTGPNILDCDDDGQLDIVVAQWQGDSRIYALRGNDGSVLWFSDEPEDWMYHGGSFADIDEDGMPEIVIGCYDGNVYVLNAEDGSLLWEYGNIFYCGGPTSIADLNNDGHLEIVFTMYSYLKVLSHTGNLLWSQSTGGSIFRGAAISDTDGDGILDVVFGSADGILRALRGNDGSLIWSIDLENHYGNTFDMDNAPVIEDFDDDGDLDVFVVGGYGTSSTPANNHGRGYALTAGPGQGPGWKMFRHDPVHSAHFGGENLSIAVVANPHNPPVIIPASGGSFEFNVLIGNFENTTATFQVWADVALPGGGTYGPTMGPVTITLPSGETIDRDRTQQVPGNAPSGEYRYHVYVGNYPGTIYDMSSFPLEKLAADAGEGVISSWYNWGESFDSFDEPEAILHSSFSILNCFPNPFNAQTVISFQLQAACNVSLDIFDVTGRSVGALRATPGNALPHNQYMPAGSHQVVFDAEGLTSGVYFVRLEAQSGAGTRLHSAVRKVLLVK